MTTIVGTGYGARVERTTWDSWPFEYFLEVWQGEQYGARSFSSRAEPLTFDEANRYAERWCEAMRHGKSSTEALGDAWPWPVPESLIQGRDAPTLRRLREESR